MRSYVYVHTYPVCYERHALHENAKHVIPLTYMCVVNAT